MPAPPPDPTPSPDAEAPRLPDWPICAQFDLPDETATAALATRLAPQLQPGDTLLLSGWLGTGKSHFARALIRARLAAPDLPVPSPSFTLVQTYDTPEGPAIWHADLYRLGDPGEVAELGLDEAMDTDICLIEWPDRLAPDWPQRAVLLHLNYWGHDGRRAQVMARDGSAPLVQAFHP